MAGTEFDPFSALMADEPTAQQMALARAAALRGQNFAGMVAGLAHEPGLQRQGPELMQQAQQGMADLGNLPGERLKRQLGQQHLTAMGPQEALLDESGKPTTQAIFEALTKNRAVSKFAPVPFGTMGMGDLRTGEVKPLADGAGQIDPAVVKQQAEIYKKTRVLPQMGKLNAQYHDAILKEVARGGESGGDIVASQAGNVGDVAALKKLQVQADSMDSFEKTALANLRMFKEQAKGVVDVGSPLFNAPARQFMQSVMGDPKMTAFNVSRQVAVQEISKVLGGGLGSAAVSDSARHEVEGLIGPDASLAQIFKAADILETDMANRKTATHAQLAEIHGRIAGKKPDDTPPPPGGAPPPGGTTPGAKPDVRTRIAQLKATGAAPDLLRKTLKGEYTPEELTAAASGR